MRLAALLALIPALGLPASAQSFTYCEANSPRRNFVIVSYDANFLFASRDYGNPRDAAGNSEPGFFVHSKARNRWIRILTVSTKDGRFGASFSNDAEESRRLRLVSVSWDFRPLAAEPFASLPLMTSGSIALPDSIVHDTGTDRYALHFMSSWRAIPSATTTLYIRRSDLVSAFADASQMAPQCRD